MLVSIEYCNFTALPWNQWTAWSSTTCLSVDTLRTRQRSRNRASCVNVGDCEDNCDSEIENKTSKLACQYIFLFIHRQIFVILIKFHYHP